MLSENKRRQKHKNTQLLRRGESGTSILTGKTRSEAVNFLVFMSCFVLPGITGESTHKRKHKKRGKKEIPVLVLVFMLASRPFLR